ncbi:unnamed protein product, partial [Vitis vinifera]
MKLERKVQVYKKPSLGSRVSWKFLRNLHTKRAHHHWQRKNHINFNVKSLCDFCGTVQVKKLANFVNRELREISVKHEALCWRTNQRIQYSRYHVGQSLRISATLVGSRLKMENLERGERWRLKELSRPSEIEQGSRDQPGRKGEQRKMRDPIIILGKTSPQALICLPSSSLPLFLQTPPLITWVKVELTQLEM